MTPDGFVSVTGPSNPNSFVDTIDHFFFPDPPCHGCWGDEQLDHWQLDPGNSSQGFWDPASLDNANSLQGTTSFWTGKENNVEEHKDKEMDNSIGHHSTYDSYSSSSESNEDEIQSESLSTINVEKCQANCQVPEIGMVFSSEEATYEFYKTYAGNIGFSVRKGKVQRSKDGTITKRYFFCSRQGFRLKKQANTTRKYKRKETRTGCEAKIQFSLENGKWVVSGLNLGHNHELVSPSHRSVIISCRNISEANAIVDSVNEDRMTKEAADAHNVGFRTMDCNNLLRHKKMNILRPEDVQSFINYLNDFQVKDPSFFYTMQVDAENRITGFFWRDGRSKIDYHYFRDDLILDTTFQMDTYDMICAQFVGVNHHRQNIFLGCAFLLDKTMNSFIWLFETYIRAMDGHQPKTISTADHLAMANAIGKVLTKTQHRKGMNDVFHNLTSEIKTLTELAQQYETEAEGRRKKELYKDLCQSEPPKILTRSPMEKQAANIYTGAVFELFQEELLRSLSLRIEDISTDGTTATYKLTEEEGGNGKESIVKYNCSDYTVTCSCKKFESAGILCCHALKVYNARNIFKIPCQYLLKRWTKSAKDEVVDDRGEEMVNERERPLSLSPSKLMDMALNAINKCAPFEDTRAILGRGLTTISKEVEKCLKMKNIKDFEVDSQDAASGTNCFEEASKHRMKRQREKNARDIEHKSCDETSTRRQPPMKITRGGIDQGSGGGPCHSSCVGGNFQKTANKQMDIMLSASPNMATSGHYS